jgi:hypothetical protein
MAARTSRYLGIYLNDHLAGSTGALELLKRAIGEYEGTDLGRFLVTLREDILADRRTLEQMMNELGVRADPVKRAGAWATEKLGRLKLNGQVTGRSPLTPLVELEALSMGIEGKRLLWKALDDVAADRLGHDRLAHLITRAKQQRKAVEPWRIQAAERAASAGFDAVQPPPPTISSV